MKGLLAIVTSVVLGSHLALAQADPAPADVIGKTTAPTPFEARYKATYNGSEFEDAVYRKLERLPDGRYRHSYSADHLLFFLHEESVLEMKGCTTRPVHYSSKRGNFFRKREKTIDFDWEKNSAHFNDEGKRGEFKLDSDTVDPMSVYLRIACQVTGELGVLTYAETDDDHISPRQYRLLGTELLKTSNGDIDTVRIEKVHNNKKRTTYIWLMASNPIVVVRVRQNDTDGSVYELDLSQWKPLSAK